MDVVNDLDLHEIEITSRQLIERIWHKRNVLCPTGVSDPLLLLDPRLACSELGIAYEPHPTLPWYTPNGIVEIAGVLDRDANVIYVAQRFGTEVERFTSAHELGHYLMHPGEVLHRDVPEGRGRPAGKAKIEREADYFAACFLVPVNVLREEFEKRFGPAHSFSFDANAEFWLAPGQSGWQLAAGNLKQRALAIATARRFGGRVFPSLCERFRVSRAAMGIRLIETRLINGYP